MFGTQIKKDARISCWVNPLRASLLSYLLSSTILSAQCLNVVAAACFETGWTCWTRWTRTWYRAFRICTLRGRGLTQRQHRPFVARLLRHCLGSRFALRSLTWFTGLSGHFERILLHVWYANKEGCTNKLLSKSIAGLPSLIFAFIHNTERTCAGARALEVEVTHKKCLKSHRESKCLDGSRNHRSSSEVSISNWHSDSIGSTELQVTTVTVELALLRLTSVSWCVAGAGGAGDVELRSSPSAFQRLQRQCTGCRIEDVEGLGHLGPLNDCQLHPLNPLHSLQSSPSKASVCSVKPRQHATCCTLSHLRTKFLA